MESPQAMESEPGKVETSYRVAPSPTGGGGRRNHLGTKRKRTVCRDKAAGLPQTDTVTSSLAPSRDAGIAGTYEGSRIMDSKPAVLAHPKHVLKGKEIKHYDVRQIVQGKAEVLQASRLAEEFAAISPLPRITSGLKGASANDNNVVRGSTEEKETQALPIKGDAKPRTQEHKPAGKRNLFTWNGEVVSRSELKRLKAKSRTVKVKQSECKGQSVDPNSANSSAQHSSQLSIRLQHNKPGNARHPSVSPLSLIENLLQNHIEQSENMSNLRGAPPSNRGRISGRTSRDQSSPDDIQPGFHIPKPTSTGGARRPRGFQPSEVNKMGHDRVPVVETSKNNASMHAEDSATVQYSKTTSATDQTISATKTCTPPKTPAGPQESQLWSDLPVPSEPVASSQAVLIEAAQPEITAIDVEPPTRLVEDETSPVRLTNPEATPQGKPSCWSKVTSQPEDSVLGWDSGTQDLSQPSWKLKDALPPTLASAGKRANMANLPPYKFPRKRQPGPASESFNRQIAGIQRTLQKQISLVHRTTNSPTAKTVSAAKYNSPDDAIHATKSNSTKDLIHTAENKVSEQAFANRHPNQLPTLNESMSTTVPPHLRGPSCPTQIANVAGQEKGKSSDTEQQCATYLETSKDGQTSMTPDNTPTRPEDEAGKATIAAMLNYKLPPHLQDPSSRRSRTNEDSNVMTLSTDHQEDNGTQTNVNIDEEVAAGLNVIDRDEELAVALQAEWSGGHNSTHEVEHNGFEVNNYQDPIPRLESSVAAQVTHEIQRSGSKATKHLDDQETTLPPHLRALTTEKSTSQPNGKTATALVKSEGSHQPGPEATRTNGTFPSMLKDTTDNIPLDKLRPSNGGVFAPSAESAVRAGKRLAKNGDFPKDVSGLAGWDGKIAPPLQGSDWANRESFDYSTVELKSVIEAWREENAIQPEVKGFKLDIDNEKFQTGDGLAGGDGDVLSPIDAADHEAIPNDDDFSQIHRDQNAAAAIERFKAQTAADGRSTKIANDEISNGIKGPGRRERKRVLRGYEEDYIIQRRKYAPEANIYLRPAELHDMRQCTEIYNDWARDSSFTVTNKPVDKAYWEDCFGVSQDEQLPFLVAVHMGEKRVTDIKNLRRKKREIIVGFSVATFFGSRTSVYRYSVELELYVAHTHLRQGIGRTMLDRMLAALCPGYSLLECAPLLLGPNDHMHAWVGGGVPIIHTVIVNLLYSAEKDKDNVEWKKKWLSSDRNDFEHTGTIPRIGFKFVKPVNNCLMVRESGSMVEPL